MTLALSTDKAVYYVGETATATLTGTAPELARTWLDLGSAGGIRSGLKYAVPGLVVWSDTASRTWTVSDRTDTSVTATTGPLVGTGSATVTATIGAAHADAAYTVNSTTPPAGVRKLKGVTPWFNPFKGALVNRADALLAPDWVGGMSAFARWDDITDDGVTFRYTGFDKVSAAAAKAHKPWALMVILGSQGNGLPGHVISGVPANEWIDVDGGKRFPVFWSPKANAFLQSTMAKLAARYSADPWLAQVRVTGFWSTHGEPWFAGGDAGKPKWCAAWRATHPADAGLSDAATLVKVQDAYQAQELAWWAAAAALWPSHTALAQAAGDGLYDNALSPAEWEQPGRHPRRLATWTTLRGLYTTRANFQFNGVNAGDGASGYGRWLPNSLGPVSPSTTGDAVTVPVERRGRIGSQPVAGAGTARLTYDGFVTMIRNLAAWKYAYCEVYGTDVAAAIDGTTADWIKVRNVMNEQKGNWYTS